MKRTLSILAILAALTFGGCKSQQQLASQDVAQAQTERAARIKTTAKTSHPCGVVGKNGKACTRRVSDKCYTEHTSPHCWQHRDA